MEQTAMSKWNQVGTFRRGRYRLRAVILLMLAVLGLGLVGGPRWPLRPAAAADENPFPRRSQKAPNFPDDLKWINTQGPLDLKQLRGKFVLLDFWTYCCINCMHILPELKKLEQAYPNELVVIGVHSAKFETEKDADNITEAVMRYEIEHPVVVDSAHDIWNRYAVRSWPSFRIIDPEGYLVAQESGEVKFEQLDEFFKNALPYYRQKGLIDATPLHFELAANRAADTPLRYPGKVLADEKGKRLFIADSNHNRIVVSSLDGALQDVIGSGAIGQVDGDYDTASFNKPQGMALHDETLYVADTENHLLRKIDLKTKRVQTIAGLGKQAESAWPGMERIANAGMFVQPKHPVRFVGKPRETGLNSPWALWIHHQDLYIAMAGPHQIWKMPLDEHEIGPYAGNGREDIVDGPLLPKKPYEMLFASFAQPSGLSSDGKTLFVADSEGSSIREVPFDPTAKVTTLIGSAHLQYNRLFEYGDIDGPSKAARFQHCLDVAYDRGQLYVADTYNNKIKVIDLKTAAAKTLVGDRSQPGLPGRTDQPPRFDEPAGLSVAAGKLYVADTNNHLIRVVDLDQDNRVTTLEIKGLAPPEKAETTEEVVKELPGTQHLTVEPVTLKSQDGAVQLAVTIKLPKGYKINTLGPMSYTVKQATGTGGLDRSALDKPVKVNPPSASFTIPLPVTAAAGEDRVHVAMRYFYCQEGAEGLCKVGAVDWDVPLIWSAKAPKTSGSLEVTAP